MKKRALLVLIIPFVLLSSCTQSKQKVSKNNDEGLANLPRVAIAGIAIESSTFSPARTHEEAFHARTGEAVVNYYPFLAKDSINRKRAIWFPTITGHALPGGTVTREAYESLLGKTLKILKSDLPYEEYR